MFDRATLSSAPPETERSVELIIVVTAHMVAPPNSALASVRTDLTDPASSAQRLGNEFYF